VSILPEDVSKEEYEEVDGDEAVEAGADEVMSEGKVSPVTSVNEEEEKGVVEEEENKLVIQDRLGPQEAMKEGYKDISDFKVIVVQKEHDPYLQHIVDHAMSMCKDIPWNLRTTKVNVNVHTTLSLTLIGLRYVYWQP